LATSVRTALVNHGEPVVDGSLRNANDPLARTFPSAEMPVIDGLRDRASMSPLWTSADTAPTSRCTFLIESP
jgi:hypothetical protein